MTLVARWPRQDEFNNAVYAAGAKYGVDPALIKAVIGVESSFNPRAINPRDPGGAWGLMQMLDGTARMLGFTGLMPEFLDNPALAIDYGTKYLSQQQLRYAGVVADTASAYNAGSAWRVGSGYGNQEYVNKVLATLDYFRAWDAQNGGAASAAPFPGDRGAAPGPGAVAGDAEVAPRRRGCWPVVLALAVLWSGLYFGFCR